MASNPHLLSSRVPGPMSMIRPPDPRALRGMQAAYPYLFPLPDESGDPPGMREMRQRQARPIYTMRLPDELPHPMLYELAPPVQAPSGPHIRVGKKIPAGLGVMLGDQPLPPLNGPKGYGVHAPRLEKLVQLTAEGPPAAYEQQPYVPFNLPPPQKALDLVDPKWEAMFDELMKLDKDGLGSKVRDLNFSDEYEDMKPRVSGDSRRKEEDEDEKAEKKGEKPREEEKKKEKEEQK
ncbi:hypothetical protein LTR85_009569 [Meristemomyces frigidus]|nr:hypothetical protein LTR85_009569 [Meristemomyces frigidus]